MNDWLTKTVHVLPVPVDQETDYIQKKRFVVIYMILMKVFIQEKA